MFPVMLTANIREGAPGHKDSSDVSEAVMISCAARSAPGLCAAEAFRSGPAFV
jgi:hypothetical protein